MSIDWETEINSGSNRIHIEEVLRCALANCGQWDQVLVIWRQAEPRDYGWDSAGVVHAHGVYMARWLEHVLLHMDDEEEKGDAAS